MGHAQTYSLYVICGSSLDIAYSTVQFS